MADGRVRLSPFHPVRSRRTFEEALEQIADAIRAGDFRVGERLPAERTLAAELEISRPTLREALRLLVQAGVLRAHGGGTFVRSEEIPPELVRERADVRLGEVAQVLETRRLIEPRVAQLAGLYADEDDFEAMERAIERQREYADDRERVRVLDDRFHLAIARATGNDVVVAHVRLLLRHLAIARDMALRSPTEPEQVVASHERTLAAIRSRDADEIDAAMDEHLSILERIWQQESGRPRLRRLP